MDSQYDPNDIIALDSTKFRRCYSMGLEIECKVEHMFLKEGQTTIDDETHDNLLKVAESIITAKLQSFFTNTQEFKSFLVRYKAFRQFSDHYMKQMGFQKDPNHPMMNVHAAAFDVAATMPVGKNYDFDYQAFQKHFAIRAREVEKPLR